MTKGAQIQRLRPECFVQKLSISKEVTGMLCLACLCMSQETFTSTVWFEIYMHHTNINLTVCFSVPEKLSFLRLSFMRVEIL